MNPCSIFARLWMGACAIAVVVLSANTTFAQPERGRALQLPPYQKVKLENGLTLLLMEHHEVPLASFQVMIRAGSTADPAGREGLASITANLLRKGTQNRTSDQISAELDFIGAEFDAGAGPDFSLVSAEFMNKDLEKGLDLLADVLLNPTFPADEVTKLLKQRIDGIKAAKDQAQGVVGQYFNAYLFQGHPYARPASGDENSLPAIAREDVLDFHSSQYSPANTIIAAVGNFRTAELQQALAKRFSAWQRPVKSRPQLPEPKPVQGKRLLLVDKPDTTQTFFQMGNVGISRTHPDRVAIAVVNTILGGRFTSLLNTELRVKAGLTYGASSGFDERLVAGPFAIRSFTPNPTTEQALDLTLQLLQRLHNQGISETDLDSAKNYLKGQFPLGIETSDQLAATIAELEFFGLDERDINLRLAKVEAVTLEESRRIIRQYFPLENLVFALIGKAAEIEPILKKYAPQIDKKSITQPGF